VVQIYQNYDEDDEGDTEENEAIIYVGSNDGQIHAFRDADGYELWSFIPQELLPYLQNLPDNDEHEYFIDGSPILLVYDYDKDGNIGTGPEMDTSDTDSETYGTDNGDNDRVILIFGLRRGGGINNLNPTESRGAYYALDVTNPETPEFMWRIDSETTDDDGNTEYAELGETWSTPVLDKVRYDGTTRIIAFIGAGYDNNEDLRFGDTQNFPKSTYDSSDEDNSTDTTGSTSDAGDVTSTGSEDQLNPRGRGIYLLELGYYDDDGVAQFHYSPVKLWEYVYSDDTDFAGDNPTYSFPTELVPLDTDSDDYIDRIYAGDTGGNMWRFDIASKTSQDDWSGYILFSANPGDDTSATNGRKIFYRPAVVYESGYTALYFGSGDRAHPQNQAVVDRLYAFYDRDDVTDIVEDVAYSYYEDESSTSNIAFETKSESEMTDVTDDTIQEGTDDEISAIETLLYSSSNYGWYIQLNEEDYEGEKVLAYPTVYNGVVYFTTYVPEMDTEEDDPCMTSQLGTSYLYALDYENGGAAFENTADDDLDSDDRKISIGSGIASNVVISVSDDDTSALVGSGEGVVDVELDESNTTYQIYWLMK
jgi:type IV pilus assembly protein PilY1